MYHIGCSAYWLVWFAEDKYINIYPELNTGPYQVILSHYVVKDVKLKIERKTEIKCKKQL